MYLVEPYKLNSISLGGMMSWEEHSVRSLNLSIERKDQGKMLVWPQVDRVDWTAKCACHPAPTWSVGVSHISEDMLARKLALPVP